MPLGATSALRNEKSFCPCGLTFELQIVLFVLPVGGWALPSSLFWALDCGSQLSQFVHEKMFPDTGANLNRKTGTAIEQQITEKTIFLCWYSPLVQRRSRGCRGRF